MKLEEKIEKIMIGFSNGNLLCVDQEMLINTINFLLRRKTSIFPNIGIFWSSSEDQKNICYPVEILDYSDDSDDYEENGAYWWLYNHTQYAPISNKARDLIKEGIKEYIDTYRNYVSECQQNNILLVP